MLVKPARISAAALLKLVAVDRLIAPLVFTAPFSVMDSVPLSACSWVSVIEDRLPPRNQAGTPVTGYCANSSEDGLMLLLSKFAKITPTRQSLSVH